VKLTNTSTSANIQRSTFIMQFDSAFPTIFKIRFIQRVLWSYLSQAGCMALQWSWHRIGKQYVIQLPASPLS